MLEYLNYPQQIVYDVTNELGRCNHSLVHLSRMTLHPQDDYLYLVVGLNTCSRDSIFKYTSWVYNASMKTLVEGVYNLNYPQALNTMLRKMR